MKCARLGLLVAPALFALACGSSSTSTSTPAPAASSTTSPSTTANYGLSGTYVPEGDMSLAQFASLSFTDGTHYSLTRANCDSGTCSSQGTYTYSGEDLELTDATTHATEHVDFQAVSVGSTGGTTTTQSVHILGLGGSLVSDAGSIVTSEGSLLKQVIEGLVNGLLMKLIGSDSSSSSSVSDGGAGTTPGIPPQTDVDVKGAIAELQNQLATAPLQPYYADGTRAEGCWLNPVGKDLTDIQKAFYCSMPLELRLCNSLVLLTTSDSQVDERWQEYLACEERVDQIAGGSGQFLYDAKINATYYWLFLNKDSGLSATDEASVAASVRPPASGKSFSTLVTEIVGNVATEAATSEFPGLSALLDQAKAAASAAGASIP